MVARGLVVSLVQEWGLHAEAVEYPDAGTMNEIAIVTTQEGRVVLRGHRHRERRQVVFEHDVMAYTRDHGLPVPAVITTTNGDLLVERDGRLHSLFQHADGHQIQRDHLDEMTAAAMGQTLGRLHTVLRPFHHPDTPRARRNYDRRTTLQHIESLLAHLAARDDRGEQEAWATERLLTRAAWLRQHSDLPTIDVGAEQVIHGDYQDTNLFFAHGAVSSIIDWDKAERRSPGEEVVRAMHLSLQLDPTMCRSFLDGYRSVTDLSDEQLHQAATVYAQGRACDLWLYETIYLHGDDRPRRFLTPGLFTPFLDRWQPLEASLH